MGHKVQSALENNIFRQKYKMLGESKCTLLLSFSIFPSKDTGQFFKSHLLLCYVTGKTDLQG